jgi:hypothetical protein
MPIIQNVMTDAFSLHELDSKSSGLPRTLGEQIAARQRALEDIDRAQFGWYHVRSVPPRSQLTSGQSWSPAQVSSQMPTISSPSTSVDSPLQDPTDQK